MPPTERADTGAAGSDGLFAELRARRVLRRGVRRRRPGAPALRAPAGPAHRLHARRPAAPGPPARRGVPQPGHHLHRLRRGRGHRAHLPDGPAAPHHPGRRVGSTSRPAWCSGCTALNAFLDDLYVGERAAIHDGIIPTWLVRVVRRVLPRGVRHPGAARRPLPGRRHRPRARRRGHLPGARGQPPQPERHLLRASRTGWP